MTLERRETPTGSSDDSEDRLGRTPEWVDKGGRERVNDELDAAMREFESLEKISETRRVSEAFAEMHMAMRDAFAENPAMAADLVEKITQNTEEIPTGDEEANTELYDELSAGAPEAVDPAKYLLGNLTLSDL